MLKFNKSTAPFMRFSVLDCLVAWVDYIKSKDTMN